MRPLFSKKIITQTLAPERFLHSYTVFFNHEAFFKDLSLCHWRTERSKPDWTWAKDTIAERKWMTLKNWGRNPLPGQQCGWITDQKSGLWSFLPSPHPNSHDDKRGRITLHTELVGLQFVGPPQLMTLIQGTDNGHNHEELCIVLHGVPYPEMGGSAHSHSCFNHLPGRLLQSAAQWGCPWTASRRYS